MSDISKKIGQIVKERREQFGLSQVKLGKSAGVTQKTISAIEKGKQGMNSGTMMKLARVLDLSPSELIGTTQTPLPPHLVEASLPEDLRTVKPPTAPQLKESPPQLVVESHSRLAAIGAVVLALSSLNKDGLEAVLRLAKSLGGDKAQQPSKLIKDSQKSTP